VNEIPCDLSYNFVFFKSIHLLFARSFALFLFVCNYQALLSWLLQKKKEGFWIVGLEQTSSSVPLHTIDIPEFVSSNNNKTVLLLGKEKEGIPVQFLQAVDRCVEIPQFGMIRSLNVHVSGAITIWELTRKTRLELLEE
jgi:tRNA G18 (ribose-2'-O)-methylase SpoU